jgi:sulfoxide reductase catalytic subunit YedY
MWTRRKLLKGWLWASLIGFVVDPLALWAKTKKMLQKGFPKDQLLNMNPADVDSRNLEIDPLDKFGTMGPTDVPVDIKTFRLRITGEIDHPVSLTYDQVVRLPAVTEAVLLICPGFFTNNGRWTGVTLATLLQEAKVKREAKYVDIKGIIDKVVRIPLEDLQKKKILMAYRVNGEVLPQKHGFPLRLVYEDAYGYDWVKYVDEIVVL